MRWFLGLVLVVALIAGALYGVGRLLLPNGLEVTRTIIIERPRAGVYAMANDLRIVREWSPYYARDPDAEYAFSGEAGPGQTMRWSSTVREVGEGRMSIVRSSENQSIEGILELGDRATLNTRFDLTRRTAHQTGVSWTVTAECAQGQVNVPCRYMNLIMRGMIERDLDAGLLRLKTLSQQLPDIDFEGLDIEVGAVEPRPYVYVAVTTPRDDPAQVEAAVNSGLSQVETFMASHALVRAGPHTSVTTAWDQQMMSFRVGYPYSGPAPLTIIGVQVGQTPGGRAAHVVHRGPRSQLPNTYAAIHAYLCAHRIARDETQFPWEMTLNEGAENEPMQVEIFIPLSAAAEHANSCN